MTFSRQKISHAKVTVTFDLDEVRWAGEDVTEDKVAKVGLKCHGWFEYHLRIFDELQINLK